MHKPLKCREVQKEAARPVMFVTGRAAKFARIVTADRALSRRASGLC